MKRLQLWILAALFSCTLWGAGLASEWVQIFEVKTGKAAAVEKIYKTEEQWKQLLTPEQFHIARKKGTEQAFTGPYWNNHEPGIYRCVCCGTDLFSAEAKFDSGTGWPSFWQPVAKNNVKLKTDSSFFMKRTEVLCARCEAHLGHVFDDGPAPTHLRYCINGTSLKFDPAAK